MTRILKISASKLEKGKLIEAAMILKMGGLVAFPTETVYGLGANALDAKAVRGIFKAKGRPSDNPLIVHIASAKELESLVKNVPVVARKFMRAFWPGPLTIVFEKTARVPSEVSAGLDSVAVRMPSHKIALALIVAARVPLAAPSANLSGSPSPTRADHVISDLDGKVDMIIDGGKCAVGLESTVVDCTVSPPMLLRPGKVTLAQLRRVAGEVEAGVLDENAVAKSPGMKYRHYAPNAQVILVEGGPDDLKKKINALLKKYMKEGRKVAVMTLDSRHTYSADIVKYMGTTPTVVARHLFATFRELDHLGMDVIIVEGMDEKDLGLAIMNRIRRAAEG